VSCPKEKMRGGGHTRVKRKRKKRDRNVGQAESDENKRQTRWCDSAQSNTLEPYAWKPNQLSTIRTYHDQAKLTLQTIKAEIHETNSVLHVAMATQPRTQTPNNSTQQGTNGAILNAREHQSAHKKEAAGLQTTRRSTCHKEKASKKIQKKERKATLTPLV
jgi:hypothetical protein